MTINKINQRSKSDSRLRKSRIRSITANPTLNLSKTKFSLISSLKALLLLKRKRRRKETKSKKTLIMEELTIHRRKPMNKI
jgi:hypothetical protein